MVRVHMTTHFGTLSAVVATGLMGASIAWAQGWGHPQVWCNPNSPCGQVYKTCGTGEDACCCNPGTGYACNCYDPADCLNPPAGTQCNDGAGG